MKRISLIFLATIVLASCGGGGSDSPSTLTGVFIDSPVINIGYRTATQNGTTNSRGEFKYLAGETVTFFIGDLEFPPVLGAEVVTPLDMADTDDVAHHMVINIIRLLQSLDEDLNPGNGITITQTAKDNALAVNFDLPVGLFENQTAVNFNLVNGGQDLLLAELVSVTQALLHFVLTLTLSGEITMPDFETFLIGTWRGSGAGRDFALLSFFDDGTYVHAVVGELNMDGISGMEWGSTDLSGQGFNNSTQRFDNNGSAGLTPFKPISSPTWVFSDPSLTSSVDILPIDASEAKFGLFDENTVHFTKIVSEGLLGTWLSTTTENDLLMLVFFDDGTYFHGETDEDDDTEISGMELGTYVHDESTGLLTATQTFDNNGSTGLTDFVGIGAPNIFVEVVGDTLTATIDEDGDELIDETIVFKRQHL
jgi:hypothetical protein